MQIERTCKICGTGFQAIKHTQHFCCRKCFKKDYYQRTKAKLKEIANRRPQYKCPHCENASFIEFDPLRNIDSFEAFICPFCGIPRAILYERRYDMTFTMGSPGTAQFVISSAIVSGPMSSLNLLSTASL